MRVNIWSGIITLCFCLPTSLVRAEISQYKSLVSQLMIQDKKFKSLTMDLEIQKKNLEATLQTWDMNVALGATQRRADNEDSLTQSVEFSATQPKTGTDISLSYQNNAITNLYTNVTSLELSQNLWKDSLGRTTRRQNAVIQSRMSLAYIKTQEELEDYLEDSILEILNLIEAEIVLKAARNNQRTAEKLEKNIRERFRSGIALESDYLESQVSRMEEQESVRQYELNLDKAWATLKVKIGTALKPKIDLKASTIRTVATSTENLRLLKILKNEQDIAESEVILAEDALDPELNGVLGIENRKLRSSSDKEDYYYLGVRLNLPVRNISKRLKLAEKKQILEKYKIDIDIQKRELLDTRSRLEKDMTFYTQRLSLHKKKIALQEKVYQQDMKRFNNGLLSLRDVITSQDALGAMLYERLQYLVELERTHIRWLSLNDQLLSEFSK